MKRLFLICLVLFVSMTVSFGQWTFSDGYATYQGNVKTSGNILINPTTANKNYLLFQTDDTKLGIIGSDGAIGGQNQNNFGIYVYGNNDLEMWTNWSKRLVVKGNGNIGIGTISPSERLHVSGNILGSGFKTPDVNTSYSHLIRSDTDGAVLYLNQVTATSPILRLSSGTATANEDVKVTFEGNGNVGIGTITPAYKLDVVGTVRAHEVRVNTDKTADFVFAKEYQLPSLQDIEEFISINGHLPEIASADEMLENGINMSDFQIQLLQKIEELTLYTIDQHKKIEKQQKEIETLKNLNERIKILEEALKK